MNCLTEVRYPAEYGLAGNPRKVVNPSYDETSRLAQLTVDGQIQMNQIVYNPMSQVTSLMTGASTNNADVETYAYDAQTALLTNQKVVKANSNTTLLDLSYEYNRGLSNGNLNGKTGQLTHIVNNLDRNKDRVYEFDTLGRLRTAKGGGATGVGGVTANWTQNYTFDRYGNRQTVTPAGVTANSAAVPADGLPTLSYDQPSNRINTSGYLYDLAGNLTKGQDAAGNWQTYEYDQAGRMLRVRDAANNILETATFAADRNRIINETQTQRTYYAWGGSSVICEYTEPLAGNTPTYSKSYIYAGSRLLSTFTNNNGTETLAFQHPDRLGTKLITNPVANTSFEQATLPFGTSLDAETTGTTNQRFTSYDRSAGTGLDYAVNRSYSAAQGRFTSVDPSGMSATAMGDPQSLNLYAYTGNNPIDFTDPSGLFKLAKKQDPISIGEFHVEVTAEPDEVFFGGGGISDSISNIPYVTPPLEIGGGGGTSDSPAQQQDTTRKTPLFRWKHCKQGKNGSDIWEIKQYLNHYGLDQFIDMNTIKMDTVGKDKEGITFTFTNAAGAAAYLKANPNDFKTGLFGINLGGQHDGSVSGGKVALDRRGKQGKGELPDKSLQFDIGSPDPTDPSGKITGYADLDCDSPAQIEHLPKHACKVFGICG